MPAQVVQRETGGQVPAQPVDAAAGRRRRGAEIDPAEGRPVGDEPACRPEQELPEIHGAVVQVTAHEVPVVPFQVGRAERVAGEDELAEARSEPLTWPSSVRSCLRPSRWNMAIRPGGLATRGIERPGCERRTKGRLETRPTHAIPLGRRDLAERAAEMDRAGACGLRGRPRDRRGQRPVELEGARAVAVAAQRRDIAFWQAPAGDAGELAGATSARTRSARGSSSTGAPVTTRPPSSCSRATSASVSLAAHRAETASRRCAPSSAARPRSRRTAVVPAAASNGRRCRRRAPAPALR